MWILAKLSRAQSFRGERKAEARVAATAADLPVTLAPVNLLLMYHDSGKVTNSCRRTLALANNQNTTMTLSELLRRSRYMLIPTFDQIGELRDPQTLKLDILAGITVALVLVPQSMAYAQLAGLPPYYGLYASFLPPMIAAIFGSSRQLATGPVAVVSLMTAASLEPLATAGSEGFLAYATLLAIMIGIFQMALGILRLGVLVDFLSHPVVVGFTNAGAIIIGAVMPLDRYPRVVSMVVKTSAFGTPAVAVRRDLYSWPTWKKSSPSPP